MRTPEQRRQRRVRRQAARFRAEHPLTPKTDPLHNAVAYLRSLPCDESTKRQRRLTP